MLVVIVVTAETALPGASLASLEDSPRRVQNSSIVKNEANTFPTYLGRKSNTSVDPKQNSGEKWTIQLCGIKTKKEASNNHKQEWMPRKLWHHHSTQKKKVKNEWKKKAGNKKKGDEERETKRPNQQEESTTIQQNTASILNAIQTPQNLTISISAGFPTSQPPNVVEHVALVGASLALDFFHDSRYGCYVTKGLQDWSSFDSYLVSIDPCILSILGVSMLNHLEPHPYLLMLDIDIDG